MSDITEDWDDATLAADLEIQDLKAEVTRLKRALAEAEERADKARREGYEAGRQDGWDAGHESAWREV